MFQQLPTYSHLHTFGCICFVLLPTAERKKLSAQSSKCAFLGYANDQKGFLCYDPKVNRFRVSRNVVFYENQYFFQHHHDNDMSPLISFDPDFDEAPISSVDNTKPIIVYERRRRENTTMPDPPDNIISPPLVLLCTVCLTSPLFSYFSAS